jgi:asparaginyl-tRNA synthetase
MGASASSELQRIKVKKLFESGVEIVGKSVKIQGWVRTVRDQKKFAFIEVNDGSSLTGCQLWKQNTVDK